MLELKIGNFAENKKVDEEEFGSWKFVLAKEEDTISLYAGANPKDWRINYGHGNVVIDNDISSQVIGGGDICFHYGGLDITGMSGNYGIVPNSIMEEFAKLVVDQLKDKGKIKKVEVDMHYRPMESEKADPKHIEMWKKLGYEFDNKKRVLEF